MPCFKGLAVSIHTDDGPLPEYSIQKQARVSRISTYIPVPSPKFSVETGSVKHSNFAISITLLTPGLGVPYSRPSSTPEDPFPKQKVVGGLPEPFGRRGDYSAVVPPYNPLTSSANETVAAYIHFDGRQKEEVATLLRRGEETWVNSRWVSVPDSEGGGLAEREFLFREVGLERWLNGLDLEGEGKEIAARIEKRKQKLEKKRRKHLESKDSDDEEETPRARPLERNGVLRYGEDKQSPLESLSAEDSMFSSDSDSDEDDVPIPEAAGQIKVSLFRVLASGEIKRGEYSPQFDAHDDDEGGDQNGSTADVDHTTHFAKPKTLDPKTISTQTVTGIDPPDKPYATFTFFYRGRKQLQKMGILSSESAEKEKPAAARRKSRQLDLSSLGELKPKGTVGFAGYRDPTAASPTFALGKDGAKKKSADDMEDSDPDDDDDRDGVARTKPNGSAKDDAEDKDDDGKANLSPEEASKRGELAESVKKMQLKRQHSFDPSTSKVSRDSASMTASTNQTTLDPPASLSATPPTLAAPSSSATASKFVDPYYPNSDIIGSPFKKQRASMAADGSNVAPFPTSNLAETLDKVASAGNTDVTNPASEATSAAQHAPQTPPQTTAASSAEVNNKDPDGDEEL